MNHYGRIAIGKDRVTHFSDDVSRCFVCGLPARHGVYVHRSIDGHPLVPSLYLCNKHFAMTFKLPPTRHKRTRVKKTVTLLPIRKYSLRRYLETPYHFIGERIAYHEYSTKNYTWYFSLYRQDNGKDTQGSALQPSTHVVSITRLFSPGTPVNTALAIRVGGNYSYPKAIDDLMGFHHKIKSARLDVYIEATRFIEKCEVALR